MAIKLASLRANLKRENEGDWVDIPDLPDGDGGFAGLKVRGANYGPFLAARSIVTSRFARKFLAKGQIVPADVAYAEDAKLYAEHILLDWRGFDEPFDPDTISDVLSDPAYRALHDHIRFAMMQVAETQTEFVEDTGKK